MQVFFVTDLHLTEDKDTNSLSLDQERAIQSVCATAEDVKPDLILCGGDLTGLRVPHKATPVERNSLITLLMRLAELAPVIVIRGNHDYQGDYDFLPQLGSTNPIEYVAEPDMVEIEHLKTRVWCLPWIFPNQVPEGTSHKKHFRAEARRLIKRAKKSALKSPKWTNLFLAHAAIDGAIVKEGQPDLITVDPLLNADKFCSRKTFAACFFGHYHYRQEISGAAKRIAPSVYGGSLWVTEFGEPSNKGPVVFDAVRGKFSFPITPVHSKTDILIDLKSNTVIQIRPENEMCHGIRDPEGLMRLLWSGHHVRVRAVMSGKSVTEAERAMIERILKNARETAFSVSKPIFLKTRDLPKDRARVGSEQVTTASGLVAKFKAYCESRNPKVPVKRLKKSVKTLEDLIKEMRDARE